LRINGKVGRDHFIHPALDLARLSFSEWSIKSIIGLRFLPLQMGCERAPAVEQLREGPGEDMFGGMHARINFFHQGSVNCIKNPIRRTTTHRSKDTADHPYNQEHPRAKDCVPGEFHHVIRYLSSALGPGLSTAGPIFMKGVHVISENRYERMPYVRCGKSGLKLPKISLGLWHNFGGVDSFETARAMLTEAFNRGITHFDLANNYGPPPGSAEDTFGKILKQDLASYRDELVISTKAGYLMWPGPYGEWGSRKYLIASLDQSLQRMGLDYVDIFYSHRPDPETPLEETMAALDHIVRSGKALYAGVSSYSPDLSRRAIKILRQLGTPCLIHQPSYSMFNRWVEDGLLQVLDEEGVGCIAFSPLAQGLLSTKYLNGIPADSRAGKPHGFLRPAAVTEEKLIRIRALNQIAAQRGQSLPQMAIAWVLRQPIITSALIGASSVDQIIQCVETLNNLSFTEEELQRIEQILRR
jgi:L-glyceraldehyde 3-phosphate reductase